MHFKRIKTRYRRNLPHIQPIGATFFVTFRLYGSIPKQALENLSSKHKFEVCNFRKIADENKRQRALFKFRQNYLEQYDKLLQNYKNGPHHLLKRGVSELVKKELHRFDGVLYDLLAFSIMSNHVHILIDTSIQISSNINEYELFDNYNTLDQIMKRIKGPTAIYANRLLNRKGQFWERESFDVFIRNERMLKRVIYYILNNPVKANIVKYWEDYSWNYLKIYSK